MLVHLAVGVWMYSHTDIFQSAALEVSEVSSSAELTDRYGGGVPSLARVCGAAR